MSSEAAAYFPEALVNTPEPPTSARSEPELPAHLLNKDQSQPEVLELPAGTVVQIAETSDERLLEQVQMGAKEALTTLFRRHARAVRNVAHRILRNEAEADDLVQEV